MVLSVFRFAHAMPNSTQRPLDLRRRRGRIINFFFRAIVSAFIWEVVIRNLGGRARANRTALDRYTQLARRFRALAVDLGGVLIKLGQFAGSRADILPKEILDELSSLQDEVPPEPFDRIRAALEAELGQRLDQVFTTIEPLPVAAASLGQAHRVTLTSGPSASSGRAIVKVQRPGIDAIVAIDLDALHIAVGWLKHWGAIRRRANLEALFEEFSRTLYEELDYLAEGRNVEKFAADFADWKEIRIPQVYWALTTRRVLTMSDIGAIKISDVAAYTAQGVSALAVAQGLFKFYLQQVFVNGFFHADPHPGNLFVEPTGAGGFTLNVVDFGMVGTLPPALKAQLREAFIGIATRDVHRVVQAIDAAGWLLPSADRREIERAAEQAFARFWGIRMSDLKDIDLNEVRDLTHEFRSLIYALPFQIPSNMLYLGRALGILSGLATQIDPNFNVFEAALPFAQKMIADETGPAFKVALDQVVATGQAMLRLPTQLDRLLAQLNRGELHINVNETDRLIAEFAHMNRALGRLQWTILFMGFLLGAIILDAAGFTAISPIVFGAALVAGVWLVLRR
jgi:predicted unusual protein kinase regulating ubiquinone biosynthesis (AarF/ABC1/UbiB family)